jgi:hypothetical protein
MHFFGIKREKGKIKKEKMRVAISMNRRMESRRLESSYRAASQLAAVRPFFYPGLLYFALNGAFILRL